jgi:hypothetical protein
MGCFLFAQVNQSGTANINQQQDKTKQPAAVNKTQANQVNQPGTTNITRPQEQPRTQPAINQTPQVNPAQKDNPNAPEIKFEKELHSYGTLNQGDNGECEFVFTNTGKEPLIISNARASCGCTVPEWPKSPILPGKSDKIKVKYDTKRLGAFSKTITIESNARNSPVILKIDGNILAVPTEKMPEKKMEGTGAPVNK